MNEKTKPKSPKAIPLVLVFCVWLVTFFVYFYQYGGFSSLGHSAVMWDIAAQTLGATLGLPVLAVGFASIFKGARNKRVRRIVFLVVAVLLLAAFFTGSMTSQVIGDQSL